MVWQISELISLVILGSGFSLLCSEIGFDLLRIALPICPAGYDLRYDDQMGEPIKLRVSHHMGCFSSVLNVLDGLQQKFTGSDDGLIRGDKVFVLTVLYGTLPFDKAGILTRNVHPHATVGFSLHVFSVLQVSIGLVAVLGASPADDLFSEGPFSTENEHIFPVACIIHGDMPIDVVPLSSGLRGKGA